MKTNTEQNKLKQNRVKIFVGILTAVFVVTSIPFVAYAATEIRDGTVNISFTPPHPSINDTVTVTLTGEGVTLPSSDITVQLVKSASFSGNVMITEVNDTLQFEVTLTDKRVDVGDNTIGARVYFKTDTGDFILYKGETLLLVSEADESEASLVLIPIKESFPNPTTVAKLFDVAASGFDPDPFVPDCGGGDVSNVSQTYNSFQCRYQKPESGSVEYCAQVSADNEGESVQSNEVCFTIAHNQEEAGAGNQVGEENDPSNPLDLVAGALLVVLNTILGFLLSIVDALFGWIVSGTVLKLVKSMFDLRAGDISATVISGWTIVRNVTNMFFILALIVIGLATILRIEGYSYKRLLGKLILMALLINFSLVIGLAVIQVADVTKDTFMGRDTTIVNEVFNKTHELGIYRIGKAGSNFSLENATTSQIEVLLELLLEVAFRLLVAVAFIAMAIFMIIRFVALWILLILSPFAYFALTIPALAGMGRSWWQHFIKYAFYPAILGFFLFLINGLDISKWEWAKGAVGTGSTGAASVVVNNTPLIIILALMFGALSIASKIGTMGAGAAMNFGKKAAMLPFMGAAGAGSLAGGYLARRKTEASQRLLADKKGVPRGALARAGFAVLNPKAMLAGYKERRERVKADTDRSALRGGQEIVEDVQSRGFIGATKTLFGKGKGIGHIKTPYVDFEEREREDEVMKQMSKMSKEQFMEKAKAIENMGGVEGKRQRRGLIKSAASQGYLDDILRMDHFAAKYAKDDGTFYDEEVLNSFLHNYMHNDNQALRMMDQDLETLGKATGHYEYLGHAKYDPTTGGYERGMVAKTVSEKRTRTYIDNNGQEVTVERVAEDVDNLDNNHQAKYALSEFKKVGGRQRMGAAPHNFMGLRAIKDENGNLMFDKEGQVADVRFGTGGGKLTYGQQTMLSGIDSGALRDFHFQQPRMLGWFVGSKHRIDAMTKELVVDSQEDLNRIESLYEENAELMHREFALAAGIDSGKTPVQGFKVRIKGQKETAKPFGKPISGIPGVELVAQEVAGDKGITGPGLEKLKDITVKVHKGQFDNEAAITAEVKTQLGEDVDAEGVTEDLKNRYIEQNMRNLNLDDEISSANLGSFEQKQIINKIQSVVKEDVGKALSDGIKNFGKISHEKVSEQIQNSIQTRMNDLHQSNKELFVDNNKKALSDKARNDMIQNIAQKVAFRLTTTRTAEAEKNKS